MSEHYEQIEFDFTDGKNRDTENDPKYDLEELLQLKKANPYGTLKKEVFEEKVQGMSLGEMRELAIRVGVTPTNRQNELRKRLVNNFDSYSAQHSTLTVNRPRKDIDPTSEAYKKLKEEGLLET